MDPGMSILSLQSAVIHHLLSGTWVSFVTDHLDLLCFSMCSDGMTASDQSFHVLRFDPESP